MTKPDTIYSTLYIHALKPNQKDAESWILLNSARETIELDFSNAKISTIRAIQLTYPTYTAWISWHRYSILWHMKSNLR